MVTQTTGSSTLMANTPALSSPSTDTKRARDGDGAFDHHAKRVQLAEHVPVVRSTRSYVHVYYRPAASCTHRYMLLGQ
jgi:hypothetical protein